MTLTMLRSRWAFAALLALPLAALAREPGPPNPVRGDERVLPQGAAAFEKHCAQCHGHESSQTPEGPDLRRLDTFCRKLQDPGLKDHCLKDVDTYYWRSVLEGKVRAGLRHMPAWQDVLPEDTIWAIKTYIESRRPTTEPPR